MRPITPKYIDQIELRVQSMGLIDTFNLITDMVFLWGIHIIYIILYYY